MTTDSVPVSSGVAEEVQTIPSTDGDVYCEDDGAYIGDYTTKSGPPIELAFQYKGHFFIYKLDRKEKIDDEEEKEEEEKGEEEEEKDV